MTAVWDDTNFGSAPRFAGYSRAPRTNMLFFPTEIANGKRRRLYSGTGVRDISFKKTWSFATQRLFEAWYDNDLNEGATQFTMTDVVAGVIGTFELDPVNPWLVDEEGPGSVTVTINARRVS